MLPLLLLAVSLCAQTFELLPEERVELKGAPVTEAFLKQRSTRVVGELRKKSRDKTLTEEDRAQALRLYWFRGPLLSSDDNAFLQSLNPVVFGKVLNPAASRDATVVAAGPAPVPLAALLKSHLVLDDNGSPQQKLQLELAIGRMLESPTARKLAEEFVALGGKAQIGFEKMSDSVIFEENGVKQMVGSLGTTGDGAAYSIIRVNLDYLKMPADYIDKSLPSTLAHELLGHALENLRARKAGVTEAFHHFELNETNAGLLGWIVKAERGRFEPDHHRDLFVTNPDEYHANQKMLDAYYAATFDLEDIQDPLPVLRARIVKAEKALAAYKADPVEAHALLRPVADHFAGVHSVVRVALKLVYDRIDRVVGVTGPRQVGEYERLIAYCKGMVAKYTGTGAVQLEAVKRQAKDPFFAQMTRQVEERRKQLVKLLEEREPQPPGLFSLPTLTVTVPRVDSAKAVPTSLPVVVPTVAEWTWAEFITNYKKDKTDNPDHFKPKAKKP